MSRRPAPDPAVAPILTLLVLAILAVVVLPDGAEAASRQFNALTAASDQPSARNPAVQTLEDCPSCRPPTHAEPLLKRGCATCPKSQLPPPLAGDCKDCSHGDGKLSTAPFTTVTDTCADCEPFELHPWVGWCVDCDRTGTGVDLNNGNLFHLKTDLDIPGRGFSFRFVRRHVSGVSYDGPLGKGWDFNYNARLEGDSSAGPVTLWDGTGREDTWTRSGGGYTPPAGRFETLELVSGTPDQLLLTKPNGTEYAFEEIGSSGNWQLVSITDRVGNSMTFSYDVNDRLETISDTLGRDIDFTYTANHRIDTITDFDGRVWEYGYNGSGELTSVTTPSVTGFASGKTTTYGYTGGRLDTITDPKSQLVVDATWDGSNRVDTLRYGDSGDDFDFDYDTPSSGKTTVTDRNGNDTVYTLDSDGQVTSMLEKTNRSIRSGEGDYTTSYAYDSNGLLTQVTFPEGNKAKYTYASGTDNLTQESLENSAGTSTVESNWTYTSDFNLVATYKEPRGHDNSAYTTTYQYDFDEATAGDLNGDGVTNGSDGLLVKITRPTVTTQTPNITPSETFRYNSNGQVTRWDHPDGEIETFTYYSTGAQTGYLQKRALDDDGAGSLQLTTEWTYSDVGNIATEKDRRGYTVTYTVNDLNQVTKETIPISSTIDFEIKYEFDANDNLTKKEVENLDETGTAYTNGWITTSWTYETLNRQATRVDEVDATTTVTTTFTHDDNRNLTQIQKPEGNKIKMEWDERDLLYQRTRGFGSLTATPAVERRSWTGNRLLETREYQHGTGGSATWNTYEYSYDDFDRLDQIEDPLGHVRQYGYDLAGHVTDDTFKEWDSGTSSFTTLEDTDHEYAETGWRSVRTQVYRKAPTDTPTDHDWTYEYRKDGQLTEITDPRSNATTFTYDAAARRYVTTDEYGNKTTLTLDGNGNVTKREFFDKAQAGSSSDVTRTIDYTYDRRNLMIEQEMDPGTSNLRLVTTWDRDSRGNVLTKTLPEANEQSFTYDGRNLLLSRTEDTTGTGSATWSHEYDDNGNRTKVTDALSNETSYTWDDLDRRIKRTNADSTTYEWEYDEEDRITERTDENGTVVADTLDDLGRVTHRDITKGTGVGGPADEDYEWDGLGRLTQAENDDSVVTLTWDSLSRVHQESINWLNGQSITRTIKRTFDATGNVTELEYPDGSDIDYVIDADLDRIDQVKDGTDVLADYRYVGPFIDQLEYLNGVVRETTFDAAGRPTVVDHDDSGTTIAKFTTIYDDNGNVTSVRRAHDSDLYDVFEYDKRDQRVVHYADATSSSSPSVYLTKEELTLDAARNIDSRAVTPYGLSTATTNYDVDSRNDYDTIALLSPTWTDNGELEDDDAGTTYVWNWRGEMVSATTGGNTYTFEHDALGRRITTDFGTELRYTWAGERIVEECDVAMSPSVQATWVWGMDPEPIRMDRGGTVSYYHADAEGSVEKLTSSAAAVQESVEYAAWGDPSIASSGQGNLFLWKGEVYDFEMGLYDLREGTYDGATMLRVVGGTGLAAYEAVLRHGGALRGPRPVLVAYLMRASHRRDFLARLLGIPVALEPLPPGETHLHGDGDKKGGEDKLPPCGKTYTTRCDSRVGSNVINCSGNTYNRNEDGTYSNAERTDEKWRLCRVKPGAIARLFGSKGKLGLEPVPTDDDND